MRTINTILFVGLVTATGCKWTDFDDLEAQTWVSTTTKPNKDSTDVGLALAPLASTSGGKLAVIANGDPQYLELGYAPNGDSDVSLTVLLETLSSVQNLDGPIVLTDPSTGPTGGEVALIAPAAGGGVSVLHGAGGLTLHQVGGIGEVAAATFMTPPPATPPATGTPAPLIAAGTSVYGSYYGRTLVAPCKLVDDAGAEVTIFGLAATPGTGSDDVLVWGTTGTSGQSELLVYPGGIFNGDTGLVAPDATCSATVAAKPLAGRTTAIDDFEPGLGSQIVMVDATHALLVGHGDIVTGNGYLALYDVSAAPARKGDPQTLPGLRTATLLDLDGATYVVAGYPSDTVDGVGGAGHVFVYPLSLDTGVSATAAMELADAQPEDDQRFGRAVAVTQFNGQPVIAVAADNEVFFYFRTTLYDETRQ
jgi:hypothetical protein